MAPGALARAAHDEEVAAAEVEPQRRPARGRLEQEAPRRAEGEDRDDGVRDAPADPVAVHRDAVPAVPVPREPDALEPPPVPPFQRIVGVCEGRRARPVVGDRRGEPRHLDDRVEHRAPLRVPLDSVAERAEERGMPREPARLMFDPRLRVELKPARGGAGRPTGMPPGLVVKEVELRHGHGHGHGTRHGWTGPRSRSRNSRDSRGATQRGAASPILQRIMIHAQYYGMIDLS